MACGVAVPKTERVQKATLDPGAVHELPFLPVIGPNGRGVAGQAEFSVFLVRLLLSVAANDCFANFWTSATSRGPEGLVAIVTELRINLKTACGCWKEPQDTSRMPRRSPWRKSGEHFLGRGGPTA